MSYPLFEPIPPCPQATALRPFVPARDFALSVRFYKDLGFNCSYSDRTLAVMRLGACSFLLQNYDFPGAGQHYMLQLEVDDLEAWQRRIEALRLPETYGVRAPLPPARQPWDQVVAFVVDPTGVLIHVSQAEAA